jgi:hypothetical protein
MSELPQVGEHEVQVLAERIQLRENLRRPPVGTAKVIVFAAKLQTEGRPWPTRQEIAEHLGVSRPLVDMVVSQRSATGDIAIWIGQDGNRYIELSRELRDCLRP